jgi:3-oxoacyl-[acyl-carrier-protein] synthase-1
VSEVFISSDNIITPLGFTTEENARALMDGHVAIRKHSDPTLSPEPFYASIIDSGILKDKFISTCKTGEFTRFENLAICSLEDAVKRCDIDLRGPDTLFILSTTKGNIDLLASNTSEKIYLWNTAKLLKDHFGFYNEPMVISQACISGIQAIIAGARLIRTGMFRNVVINGTDIISEFVLSGFSSFKSLSTGPCRPFDKTRDGLSLGEGSGTIILTSATSNGKEGRIAVSEGFSMNDANHISGPSRTGEGLYLSIRRVLDRWNSNVDYICAHGTATLYNDDMESVAITRAGLQDVPVNSFKGYWGHTLGATGVIDSIMGIYSVKNGILFKTEGFNEPGTSHPLNVISSTIRKEVSSCMKIGSGFGGCNAAVIFYRYE